MRARLVFSKKEVYVDGSVTDIRIWQVPKGVAFPEGIKYAFYFIGPPPEYAVVVGYDNHQGKGHHRHVRNVESVATTPSVSALLRRFRGEVSAELKARGSR